MADPAAQPGGAADDPEPTLTAGSGPRQRGVIGAWGKADEGISGPSATVRSHQAAPCMQATSQICVVGLATMGQNLALNIARNGFPVTVYNRSYDKTEATLARCGTDYRMFGARTPQEAAASLVRPRKLILLVKATGAAGG